MDFTTFRPWNIDVLDSIMSLEYFKSVFRFRYVPENFDDFGTF